MVMMGVNPYSCSTSSVHGVTIAQTAKYVLSSSSTAFHIRRLHRRRRPTRHCHRGDADILVSTQNTSLQVETKKIVERHTESNAN
jgi:hypothetical protein